MRLARCRSVALAGVRGTVVDIEVHIGGMPGFTLVGLPDASLAEARDRVRAAVLCSGERWPLQRITVSLSPAALPKRGSHFDLGVAVAIVAAGEELPTGVADEMIFLGELALDGRLRPVPGVLPAVLAAARFGATHVVVPESNAGEARLVPGVLGDMGSALSDSFETGILDSGYYTRPEVFRGLRVPPVLLTGNHEGIRRERRRDALLRTLRRRPDLLRDAGMTRAEAAWMVTQGWVQPAAARPSDQVDEGAGAGRPRSSRSKTRTMRTKNDGSHEER